MNKHTPGPWIVKRSPFEVYNVDHGALTHEICSGNLMIAALYADEDGPDARLISAAPDLLEVLDHILEMQLRGFIYLGDEVNAKARAAIAKARGEA